MDTLTLFTEETETVTVDFPMAYGGKTLRWTGIGHLLHMTDTADPEIDAEIAIYVVRRVGGETEYIQPLVVRQVISKTLPRSGVTDYVVYGPIIDDTAWVTSYDHEFLIEDTSEYLRGEWPNWNSLVKTEGLGTIVALIEAVTRSHLYGDPGQLPTTRRFERRGHLSLSSMGTPPLQPAIHR